MCVPLSSDSKVAWTAPSMRNRHFLSTKIAYWKSEKNDFWSKLLTNSKIQVPISVLQTWLWRLDASVPATSIICAGPVSSVFRSTWLDNTLQAWKGLALRSFRALLAREEKTLAPSVLPPIFARAHAHALCATGIADYKGVDGWCWFHDPWWWQRSCFFIN